MDKKNDIFTVNCYFLKWLHKFAIFKKNKIKKVICVLNKNAHIDLN